jgi:hypothetical protein
MEGDKPKYETLVELSMLSSGDKKKDIRSILNSAVAMYSTQLTEKGECFNFDVFPITATKQ